MRSLRNHSKGTEDTMTKEIPLTQGKVAIVDDKDYPIINSFKWSAAVRYSAKSERCYAVRSVGKKVILMHRLILGITSELQCDHINGDGLDNRRSNLRIATNTQNQMNRQKQPRCTSQFKGVCWDKSRKKWVALIMVNQKHIHLGRYNEEIDAAKAYDAAAKMLFRKYANLNFKE